MKLSQKLLVTLLLFSSTIYSQVDTTFYQHKWEEMKHNGSDYRTITNAANLFYNDSNKQTKEYNYHHYRRWENFWRNRVYSTIEETSQNKFGLFHHQAGAVSGLNNHHCNSNHEDSDWESWGFNTHPLSNGSIHSYAGMGVMYTAEADPTNLQILYAGSPLGGLWKTTNQGNSWSNITDQLNVPGMSISDIAIDPNDSQHLLVATGARWSFDPPGVGVLETFDGGSSWSETGITNIPSNSGSNALVDKVYFHPTNTNRFFAFVKNELLETTDAGVTWNNSILTLGANEFFNRLEFHPTNPNTFYVATKSNKIYRTTNGGTSFTDITGNFSTATNINFINIDVSASQPNNLYVIIRFSNGSKVFKSTNSGTSSTPMSTGFLNYYGFNQGGSKKYFEVSEINDNVIIAGGINLFRSTNGGISFSSSGNGVWHPDMRGGNLINGMALLATDGGITISTDDGATWTNKYNGLNVQQCYGHDVDKDYNYLLTGLQDVGGYRYDITSGTWKNMHLSDGGVPTISGIDPTKAIANYFCGVTVCNFGVAYYSNSGNTFQTITNMPIQWHSAAARPFNERPNGTWFTGMEDVYSTTLNTGNSYSKLTDFDGTGFKGVPTNDYLVAVANTEADPNFLAAGFGNQSWNHGEDGLPCATSASCPQKKFLISNDNGATWVDRTLGTNSVKLPIDYAPLSDIIISPTDENKIWVSFGSYWSGNKVYYTDDKGLTWTNQSFDLPNYPVHSIVYQENSNDRLFVATDAGVFTKDAAMTVWDCYNTNLPPAYYVDLDVNNCGGALTVSSQGRGVWKSPLPANRLVGNITWNGTRNVGSDIIVADTLTITGTVEMAIGSKITVEVGGKLIIDGGILTTSHCVDGLWKGIELLGNVNANQTGNPLATNYPQGYVELANGGLIENAETGIYAGNYTQASMGGGRIKMHGQGSRIKNCRIGVQIEPYARYNMNTYDDGIFKNDGTIIDPATNQALVTVAHVVLKGTTIIGNEFNNLTFENTNTNLLPSERGVGIEIVGRKVGTTSNPMVDNSTFSDLFYGVRAGNLASGAGNDIENSTFNNVTRGIYILSGYSVDIKNNAFDLPNATTEDVYGLKLNGHHNFDIRNNTINGSDAAPNGTATSAGMVIENSLEAGGIVFDNTIGNGQFLETGIQAQGNNQNLTIRCNDIEYQGTNPHGIAIYDYFVVQFGQILANDPAQLRDQGHPNCQTNGQTSGDPKAAAGNEWINQCSSGQDEEIDMEPGMQFKYYFHSNNALNQPTTEPDCSDPNWNSNTSIYVDCGINKTNDACNDLYTPPSTGGGGGVNPGGGFFRMKGGADSVLLDAYEADYLNARTIQGQMATRANGNTSSAQLQQQIQLFTNNSVSTLIAASPLSDEVLNAAIENWGANYSTELKQVLTENVPLSKESWTALQQKQLARSWKQDLNTAATQHDLRDSLRNASSYVRFAKKELMLKEAQLYRKLTVDSNFIEAEKVLDSSLLSASLRLLAKEYISKNEFAKAYAVLTRIEQKTDDDELATNLAFAAFNRQMISIYQNGKSANPSELPKAAVEKLQYNNGAKGDEAEALFALLSGEFKHHPVVKKRNTAINQQGSTEGSSNLAQFSIFPNPSNGNATIVYQLKGDQNALLQVFDMKGRLVKEQSLTTELEKQAIDLNHLNNGIYHFSVILKGERLFNGKLVLTK